MTEVITLKRGDPWVDGLHFPKPDLQIGCTRGALHPASELHSHDFAEIVIVDRGHAAHQYGGAEYGVQAGDVFIVRPHLAHKYTSMDQFAVSNVLFYDDGSIPLLADLARLPAYGAMFLLEPTLREREEMGGRMRLGSDRLADVLLLVARLDEALRSSEETSAAMATVCFLQLVKDLCEFYSDAPPRMGASLVQVSRAISYIENHFYEALRIADLARLVNMSLRSFQRHFERATGVPAVRYITQHRITEARKLLEAGVNVTDTAFEVGFKDPNYFSRAFRDEVGITPKLYQIQSR
ncbi:MAG: helix-turn-helix domain-containing protein [Verrucomicrobia bacterium]|jgi:AraC-like DNA-binding protein|nr:helix-turn-helix domain-containing protein [Verrucomicrobiota bacterium]MBT7067460.1 helix-turn-helix domain-containing protein [Verrucomicrobiota bacterium]MBT7701268.1 helix-turn-helix domain-containing protein [Verrucomicrobiota bacterium]